MCHKMWSKSHKCMKVAWWFILANDKRMRNILFSFPGTGVSGGPRPEAVIREIQWDHAAEADRWNQHQTKHLFAKEGDNKIKMNFFYKNDFMALRWSWWCQWFSRFFLQKCCRVSLSHHLVTVRAIPGDIRRVMLGIMSQILRDPTQ